MKVGIIGLGLMGASFARTLQKTGEHTVYGYDVNPSVMRKADLIGAITGELNENTAKEVDMLIVALYPRQFQNAVTPYLPLLKAGAIVTDFCGNKRNVIADMRAFADEYPHLFFVGGHPMAGREFSGIEHAVTTLFDKASMILVPYSQDIAKLERVKKFFLSVGFGEVVLCSAEYHDGMIAYTSQLCHVVSNAFIKNETALSHSGFSAGSYKDLTRVARMNSKMWAELMTDNRDKLSAELDELIANLQKYQVALKNGDEQALYELLEEGNERKLTIDARKKEK